MGLELADVFRRFGPDYLAKYAGAMPPSHEKAIHDIIRCRTPAMSFWHPANRGRAANVRLVTDKPSAPPDGIAEPDQPRQGVTCCPHCGGEQLEWVKKLPRPRSRSP